jgi:uncharacterized protein (TIRG00374 family)
MSSIVFSRKKTSASDLKKKTVKLVLLSVKLCIAAALLAWVLSLAHWGDYVRTKPQFGGDDFTLISPPHPGQKQLQVSRGMLWWKTTSVLSAEQVLPVDAGGLLVRRGFAQSLRHINIPPLLLALALVPLSMLIVSMRWWLLLRVQKIFIHPWEIVRLTCLGLFFNYVIPGTVGGDLVKAYYVSKHTPKKGAVLLSIFVDRIMGMVELVIMAGLMLVVVLAGGWETVERMQKAIVPIVVAGVALLGGCAVMFSTRLRGALHLQKLYRKLPLAHHIASAEEATDTYRKHYGSLIIAVLMTLAVQICFIGAIALLGQSLSIALPLWAYFVYVPLIFIIGAIPISPGGVGMVENLYVVFLASETIGPSPILALALLARFVPIFWSLPGLVVALTGAKLPKIGQIQAELEN